jgi:hypothetical protein
MQLEDCPRTVTQMILLRVSQQRRVRDDTLKCVGVAARTHQMTECRSFGPEIVTRRHRRFCLVGPIDRTRINYAQVSE